MGLVCLHFPNLASKPVGIWFWNDATDAPDAYYLPDTFSHYTEVSKLFVGIKKKSRWDRWIIRLSERTPTEISFEVVDIYVEPKKFLDNFLEMSAWE